MKLVAQAGPNAGQEFPVSGDRVSIGRGTDNDVVLRDSQVSRRHAEIHQTAEGYGIADLNSTNGTFVNDVRVSAPEQLYAGDRIQVGETILSFEEGFVAPVEEAEWNLPVEREESCFPFWWREGSLVSAVVLFLLSRQWGVVPVVLTPTPSALITPTTVPAIATSTPVPSRTFTPVPSPTPTMTPVTLCPSPDVRITSPLPAMEVAGIVEIHGTASINDFAFYKLEYGVGQRPSVWSAIGDVNHSPARDSRLAVWDTMVLPEGEYTLSLTVVDNTGNYPPPCEVTVHVKR